MNFENISMMYVYFIQNSEKICMGRLALKDRRIFFEYTPEFIETGLELSPFKLPLKPGVHVNEDHIFDGLFGLFNDSLPDGWGRLLLERKLAKLRINSGVLSALDRLRYVGEHSMGALVYEPEIEGAEPLYHKDLDEIADEVLQFQENNDDQFVEDLLAMNGSSAGSRPKILINQDGEDWLIKFRSSIDPKDIGPIEYAYHLMAKAAYLELPDAKLFPSRHVGGYFGVKRFDRQNGKRVHVHTVSGLLHVDHRIPSLDYETIMRASAWLTKNVKECEKQFRAVIFNIFSHNRDDHAKNFSFLMSERNTWHVAPAYDLTFSSGPGGEHCSMIMGEGKNPTRTHLFKLAEIAAISQQKAEQIIDEVGDATSKWQYFAKEAGVSASSTKMVQSALNRVVKGLLA